MVPKRSLEKVARRSLHCSANAYEFDLLKDIRISNVFNVHDLTLYKELMDAPFTPFTYHPFFSASVPDWALSSPTPVSIPFIPTPP